MAEVAVSNSFSAGTTAASAQVNTNFSDITTWLNNRYNGSDTWTFMKVSSTNANPVDIVSSSSTSTELSINNTNSTGDPIVTYKLSGTQVFVHGPDNSDSDTFKFGTTGITTNVAFQVPSSGVQVQFATGSSSIPSVSLIGDANTGFYSGGSDVLAVACGGSQVALFASNGVQVASGAVGSPAVTFINDSNTGWYSVSGDSMGASLGGTLRFTLANAAPFVTLGDNGNTTDISVRINGPVATAANTATLTNSPVNGNPATWIQVNINGTSRYIPVW